MSNLIEQVVGLHFRASIGEPWDFYSEVGQNLLEGKIRAVQVGEDAEPVLLCDVSPFKQGEQSIRQVIAVNRYRGSQNIAQELTQKKPVGMNFVYVLSESDIESADVLRILQSNEEKHFLVGSLTPC